MSWAVAVPIIGAVVSAGMDYFGAKKEGDAAKANTALMREETMESLRRLEYQQARTQATRRARQGASGLKLAGGSQELAMDAMMEEEAKE